MPGWLMFLLILLVLLGIIGLAKGRNATGGLLAGTGLGLVIGFRAASLEFAKFLPPSRELSEAKGNDLIVFGTFFILLILAATVLHALDERSRSRT